MTDTGSAARWQAGPEPFVAVPLWALRKARADHANACASCGGVVNAECIDPWYRDGLNKWISDAEKGVRLVLGH